MLSTILYDGLLPHKAPLFSLPQLTPSTRALVVGMGGGCDVFAAAAVAHMWKADHPDSTVLFANCVGLRPFPSDHELLAPNLYRVPKEPVPLVAGNEGYGTTLLEQSVAPRGDEGSPFMLVVPRDGKSGLTLEQVTAENVAAVSGAIDCLKIDIVLAVDLGGDSLTGGADYEGGSPEFGRDRQVLRALAATGRPVVQLIFGPGCDGESELPAMREAVKEAAESGNLLGVLPLADTLVPVMARMAEGLRQSRTPNILARAAAHVAGRRQEDDGELCVIERHGRRAEVPWSWLTVGLAIRCR